MNRSRDKIYVTHKEERGKKIVGQDECDGINRTRLLTTHRWWSDGKNEGAKVIAQTVGRRRYIARRKKLFPQNAGRRHIQSGTKMYTFFTHQYLWNKFKSNFYFSVTV